MRTGILVAAGAVILSTGMVVTLREPPPPPAPTISERALLDAYEDAGALRSAGAALASVPSLQAPVPEQLGRTVTLLTVQEKALFRPLPETSPATDSGAATSSTTPGPDQAPEAAVAAFLAELAASAGDRLTDAGKADGATARLLAAAGTVQLLEARSLAALTGTLLSDPEALAPVDIPAPPVTPSGAVTGTAAPSSFPSPECSVPASSEAPAALTAVLEAERQGDYGYQVALPRLAGEAVAMAEAALLEHQGRAREASMLLGQYCLQAPAAAAGYDLDSDFLTHPAGGLGGMEAGALPVYGDLVAFSEGTVREWAVRSLLETAERASGWGADVGAFPGLAVKDAQIPPLPGQQPGTTSQTPFPGPSAAAR